MVVAEEYIHMVANESVPIALNWADIVEASKQCEEIVTVVKCVESNDYERVAMGYQAVKSELSVCDSVLLRGERIVIPVSLRSRCIELAHEGHQGIVKTKQRLRTKVWWPSIDREAEQVCRSCEDCIRVGAPNPPVPLCMTKFPSQPWQHLSCDILGPLPNGQSVFVVVDYYSRFFECAFLRSTVADKVVEYLDTVFSRMGFPVSLRSDNGPQFTSDVFQRYLKEIGVQWVSTTPLWPQANGEVERVNRTLLKALKIAHLNKLSLESELRKFLVSYRSTPHSTTGVAPYTLLFGRSMKTKLPSLDIEPDKTVHEKAAENDSRSKIKAKAHMDYRRQAADSNIEVGDEVFLRQQKQSKLDATFGEERFHVTGRLGSDIVCENKEGSRTVRRNVSFARKCPTSEKGGLNDDNVSRNSSGPGSEGNSLGFESQPQERRSRAPPLRFGNPIAHD
jgi:hypothetical protein